MREIKFRGQTRRKGERIINMAGDKCESNWVYGGIFPQNEEENGFAVIYQQEPEIKKYPVYADTVGQYTGLKDVNEKEIYEGDICEFSVFDYNGHDTQYKGVVVYSGSRFMLWKSKESEYYGDDGGFDLDWVVSQDDEFEVVGNIFDNAELIV